MPLRAHEEITAGFLAGCADALACHPVDVVKTQAHVNRGANVPFTQALVAQARAHGLPSLYRGVLPACLRPQALCMYVGYEWSKKAVCEDAKKMTLSLIHI